MSQITPLQLDPSILNLNEQEADFFKTQTNIQDLDELKRHIVRVQKRAYDVYPYRCIQTFSFTGLKIARLPVYQRVLDLGKTRPGAILLDIGCCFGNDIRKAVADGWPVENAIASDINAELWNCGHDLFKSTSSTFPAGFIPGDVFSPTTISPPFKPFYTNSPPSSPRPPNLQTLTSLTPLQGHISAIHASSFFHLFNEEKQSELAIRLGSLLSPEPGSTLFGMHGGISGGGRRVVELVRGGYDMFCHSPESWMELWDGGVFERGSVRVEVGMVERALFNSAVGVEEGEGEGEGRLWQALVWSVTRL